MMDEKGKMELRYLTLKLTNKCNLSCRMCGQVYSSERNSSEIPLGMIGECIDNISTLEHIYLFGGEPLMYSNFKGLLELLQVKELPALITTNGTLLGRCAEDIVRYGVRDLDISVDSHKKDIYEYIRKSGNFELLLNNIIKIINMKKSIEVNIPELA